MALTGITTYVSSMSLFIAHWTEVDDILPLAMTLRDGSTLPILTALRTEMNGELTKVQSFLNDKEIARAIVELAKTALLARGHEFSRKLRGTLLPGNPFLKSLPEMPLQSSSEGKFTDPMRDIATLWEKADAAGSTILLSGGYTAANFQTDLNTLNTSYNTLNTSEIALSLGRKKRDAVMARVRSLLGGYRLAVESEFPPDSPYVESIPRLSAKPGHTPTPVVLTAIYDVVEENAVITFSESSDATLREYQIRAVPGPDYEAEDEATIATIPAGAPREFRSAFSLENPGMAATYRVYTILTTNNEAVSNTQTVTRPG